MEYSSARSLVVSNLRSETKDSQFDSSCYLEKDRKKKIKFYRRSLSPQISKYLYQTQTQNQTQNIQVQNSNERKRIP